MKHRRLQRACAFMIVALGGISLFVPSGCDKLVTEITNNTVYDTTLGQACLTCHSDAANVLARPQAQWENSRHASADLIDVSVDINGRPHVVNQCGAVCHTHEQFVKTVDSVSIAIDKYSPITCFTCHKPHTGAYGAWSIDSLRGWDNFVFLANDSTYNFGKSNSCAHCHRAMGEPPAAAGADSIYLTATWGPHWSPQADVLNGKAGFQFKTPVSLNRPHETQLRTQDGCLKCHFGNGQGVHFAEHTFRLEDTIANTQFVGNCNTSGCHSSSGVLAPVVDFYDFAILDSIELYADSLEALLKSRNILDTSDASGMTFYPDSTVRRMEAQVLFNYLLYRFDGSQGIHNPEYMDFLLKQSLSYWDSMPPKASFYASVTEGCVPFDVQFTATYSGLIDSVRWDFEDNAGDTSRQPLHSFTTVGIRSVALWVYGPAGSYVAARQNYISANAAPMANFTADNTVGCDTLAVQFTNTSTGTISAQTWYFGDDSISVFENPSHVYRNPGTYTVSLVTFGPCGIDTAEFQNLITIQTNPPTSQFAVDTAQGCDSLVVSFSDQSNGDITSWKYLFGDGDSALVANPVHTYRNLGTFLPRLITSGPCGTDTSLSSASPISITTLPIAAFSANDSTVAVSTPVQFWGEESLYAFSYSWDFGDGQTSTLKNPVNFYGNPGTYTVTLTVTNSCGQDIEQKVGFIIVQ